MVRASPPTTLRADADAAEGPVSGPVRDHEGNQPDSPWVNIVNVEVLQGRVAKVGNVGVLRALPTKGRRTVGGWCFVDVMLPSDSIEPDPMEIGPHPHIGLHTVTWLLEGEAIHSDSLGTEQPIRPGQLNLMTSGDGIAHAELGTEPGAHGLQMWIAQPEETRHGASAFEHHAELPKKDLGIGEATVLVGSLEGATSPARADTSLIGADLALGRGEATIEADPRFEYGIIPLQGRLKVNEAIVEPGYLGLVSPGSETLLIEAGESGTRAMLIGGEPLGERVQMWWNFVARSREELTAAWRDWDAGDTGRFPEFRSVLDRIEAPRPLWIDQE